MQNGISAAGGSAARPQSALEARLDELDALIGRAEHIETRLGQLAQRFDPVPAEVNAAETKGERPSSYSHHLSVIVSRFDQTISLSSNHMDRIEACA